MPKLISENIKNRSDRVISWLGDHPLISRNALAGQAGMRYQHLFESITGYDQGGGGKRYIPEKYLEKMENILAEYGYKKR